MKEKKAKLNRRKNIRTQHAQPFYQKLYIWVLLWILLAKS